MDKDVKKIVLATNNQHKLKEIRSIVGDKCNILSLDDIGCHEDIPETADTIAGNAIMKASYIYKKYGVDCIADDTGLEVEALGGAPGVHTARYASATQCDSKANMDLLLKNLEGVDNRKARFVTVICMIEHGRQTLFEGICQGSIADAPAGDNGFGYDPVFIPDATGRRFAQMTDEEKNQVSHRGKATRQLVEYLLKK